MTKVYSSAVERPRHLYPTWDFVQPTQSFGTRASRGATPPLSVRRGHAVRRRRKTGAYVRRAKSVQQHPPEEGRSRITGAMEPSTPGCLSLSSRVSVFLVPIPLSVSGVASLWRGSLFIIFIPTPLVTMKKMLNGGKYGPGKRPPREASLRHSLC